MVQESVAPESVFTECIKKLTHLRVHEWLRERLSLSSHPVSHMVLNKCVAGNVDPRSDDAHGTQAASPTHHIDEDLRRITMITPKFSCEQNDKSLILLMYVPAVRVSPAICFTFTPDSSMREGRRHCVCMISYLQVLFFSFFFYC